LLVTSRQKDKKKLEKKKKEEEGAVQRRTVVYLFGRVAILFRLMKGQIFLILFPSFYSLAAPYKKKKIETSD